MFERSWERSLGLDVAEVEDGCGDIDCWCGGGLVVAYQVMYLLFRVA